MKQTLIATTCSVALATALSACGGGETTLVTPSTTNPDGTLKDTNQPPLLPTVPTVIHYEQALRSAAIKLTGNYPTLPEIQQVRDATDKKAAYETLVDAYLARPTFAAQMLDFWPCPSLSPRMQPLRCAPVIHR